MPEPYNYKLQIPSMFERISQLQAIDAQDEQAKALKQEREMKIAAQNMAIEQQKRQNEAIDSLIKNPNPSARDFAMVSMVMPKDRSEAIRKSWDSLDSDNQKNQLLFGGQVLSALTAGKPEIAIQFLDERAKSEVNAGRDGKMWNTYSKLIAIDPDKGLKTFGVMVASIPGGDKVIDAVLKAQRGPSEVAKSESDAEKARVEAGFAPKKIAGEIGLIEAQTKNALNQISDRANRLGLDKDKLASEIQLKIEEMSRKGTDLDTEAKKLINNSAMESVSSSQFAGKLNDLAGRILAEGGGKGGWNTIGKLFENLTGTQDEWTKTRNEYVRLKNNYVLKNLPQGPASDKDIRFAMEGLPPENANAEYIAQFLRGMAKMSVIDSKVKDAQADWVDSVGSLGRPRKDINVKGTMVPAGTNFNEFMYNYLEREHTKENTKAGAEQAKTRGYMKYGGQ